MKLRGRIPFDSRSADMGFREILRPGCFAKSLADKGHDVVARREHDSRLLLARRSSGTLKLSADRRALNFEFDVPATQAGLDLAILVERGDISQCSFCFSLPYAKAEKWSVLPDGTLFREILEAALHDVAPVSEPAYPEATVSDREHQDPARGGADHLAFLAKLNDLLAV